MGQQSHWQAPGNAQLFDTPFSKIFLENKNKISSLRSIGVLEFLKREDGECKIQYFKDNIQLFLRDKYGRKMNDSTKTHFYKGLWFVGLVEEKEKTIFLSNRGYALLNNIKNNPEKATQYYIKQLFETKYFNKATKNFNIKKTIYPFRLLFKLLLDDERREIITDYFCDNSLIYILDHDRLLKIFDNVKFKKSLVLGETYKKWTTWILNSLVNMNILSKHRVQNTNENGSYSLYKITETYKNFIQCLLEEEEYSDFFEQSLYNSTRTQREKNKRDPRLREIVLERDNYLCQFNSKHKTFTNSKNKKQFLEVHHIIPMAFYEEWNERNINIDEEWNLISLCPNCHRKVEKAIQNEKEGCVEKMWKIIEKARIYYEKTTIIKKFSLQEIYLK